MPQTPWDMMKLAAPPRMFPAGGHAEEGVEALFMEGLPHRGRATRAFAWLGVPKAPRGEQVPGVVLVHGGAGTAFARWVRQWRARGYAAIAVDTCGRVPRPGKLEPGRRHRHAGPDGWGGLDQLDRPVEDQWTYHAVADVILAHSLLRSLPQVDPGRVGILGISWGAYLTCLAAPVDGRFRFAVPVYGCGFLKEGLSPLYLDRAQALGQAAYDRWAALWEPSRYLPDCRMPMLWISGTNDLGFSMASRRLSCRAAPGPGTLCIRIRWPHCHQTPWAAREIPAFADHLVGRDGPPLPTVGRQGRRGREAWVAFSSPTPIVRAQLCWTADAGDCRRRTWRVLYGSVDAAGSRAAAALPPAASSYYFNLRDARGLLVSGEHVEIASRTT